VLRDGFDRHYALFRDCARAAKHHFETANWRAIRHVAGDRIDFYDRRVEETAARIRSEFRTAGLDGAGADALWERTKLHFIGLLIDHKQPECAETFFNSVSCKILHRAYFNKPVHLRPAGDVHRAHRRRPAYLSQLLPDRKGRAQRADRHRSRFSPGARVSDFRRDLRNVLAAFRKRVPRPFVSEANHQIQVLSTLFFRDQTAYMVGRSSMATTSIRLPSH
jgi:isocitrate dehydrogenase kinase/phosphatase